MKFILCLLDFKCEARTTNGYWGFQRATFAVGEVRVIKCKRTQTTPSLSWNIKSQVQNATEKARSTHGVLSSLPHTYTSGLGFPFTLCWHELSETCTERSFRKQMADLNKLWTVLMSFPITYFTGTKIGWQKEGQAPMQYGSNPRGATVQPLL